MSEEGSRIDLPKHLLKQINFQVPNMFLAILQNRHHPQPIYIYIYIELEINILKMMTLLQRNPPTEICLSTRGKGY